MNRTPQRSRKLSHSDGFSLVEVTLAIGILSFAFVAIYGLLPVSLETARKAMERTHATIISQQLLTETQQTPFDDLDELIGVHHFFDGAGVLVGTGSEPASGDWVYSAVIFEPGSTTSNNQNLGLSRSRANMLAVRIARNRVVSAAPADDEHFFQLAFAVADTRL